MPVCDKHSFSAPFRGCFLVGDYTSAAREQLNSLGFRLIHFDYPTIVDAFKTVGVDASFDEKTSDKEFAVKQRAWNKLGSKEKRKVWRKLLALNGKSVREFMNALEQAVTRHVSIVRVTPLHGTAIDCATVSEAIAFVAGYSEEDACGPLLRYEIQIRYNNGDKVDAEFRDKSAAIEFLDHYSTGNWTPITGSEDEAESQAVE
jgi:hypothetical protein